MKLLIWNIQQGGGPRRERIAASIIRHNPDIVALIEFVPGTAAPLLNRLREAGFNYQSCTNRRGFDYALCVLSKYPVISRPSGLPLLDESGLWLELTVPTHDFSFGVVHAPTSPRTRMKAFLSDLVSVAKSKADHPFLFVGDFNTGIGPADGPLNNFGDVDRFTALQTAGFTDIWRHLHSDRFEQTWCRNGKEYRIDHALVSESLLPRVTGCRYSHEERIDGISDHSVLLVEID